MVKLSEVKINISVAIAAAFGFVIALIWKEIIVGLFALAGLTINDISDGTSSYSSCSRYYYHTCMCDRYYIYNKMGRNNKKINF